MMSFIIRKATLGNLERICVLAQQSLPPIVAARKVKHLRRIYDYSPNHSLTATCFVAEEDGLLLGHASIESYPSVTEVGDLFVAKEARGRGIAGKLADAQMAYLADFQGTLFTGTVTSSTHSQQVYYSRGFVPIGFRIGWIPNYHDEHGQDDSAIMMT
ncbi:GNAT family N-acetyltransferase [Candidatus Woesearchaeota archaeon]|nr:GNAT family N-acetyltransferase [Candidatus Woesearchaeota archaeon]